MPTSVETFQLVTPAIEESASTMAGRLRAAVGRAKSVMAAVPGIDSMTSISTTSGSSASSQYNSSPEQSVTHQQQLERGMQTVEQWLRSQRKPSLASLNTTAWDDCAVSVHEFVNAPYGPVRKGQRSSECTLTCTSPSAAAEEDEDDSLSASSLQSATSLSAELGAQPSTASSRWIDLGSGIQQANLVEPQTNVKIRYSHYENASVFVALASRLVHKDARAVCLQQPFSVFRAENDDPVLKANFASFAERLAYGLRCKYPCYVLALMYLEQLKTKQGEKLPITAETFQRLAIAAVVVAAKFYDDLYYSNEHYARELGYRLETLNTLEICFLVVQDFNLRVSSLDFDRMMHTFDDSREMCCEQERQPVWSGLKSSGIPGYLVPVVAATNSLHASGKASLAASSLYVDADIKRGSDSHLVSREWRGYRYETEEECLHKSEVLSQCRSVKKLLDQYEEEVQRQEARRHRWRHGARQVRGAELLPTNSSAGGKPFHGGGGGSWTAF